MLSKQQQLDGVVHDLSEQVVLLQQRVQDSAAEEEKREEQRRVQLSALQDILVTLSASWKDEQEAASQRERALRTDVERGREEDRQQATAAWEETMRVVAASLERAAQLLSIDRAAHTAVIDALSARLTQAEGRFDATAEAAKAQTASLSAQLAALDEEVGSIRGVLDSYNDDIAALTAKADRVEQQLRSVRGDCEHLLTSSGDLTSRIKRRESDGIEEKAEVAERRLQVQRLEVRVGELAQQLEQLMVVRRRAEEEDAGPPRIRRDKAEEEQKRAEENDPLPAAVQHSGGSAEIAATAPPPPSAAVGDFSATPLKRRSSAGNAEPTALLSPPSTTSFTMAGLSSVFPSISSSDADAQRQAGVFTSPAKANSSNTALAWTVNVKDGGAKSPAAAAQPPRPSDSGPRRDAASRSGSVSVTPTRTSAGGSGAVLGGERSSPASSRTASISVAVSPPSRDSGGIERTSEGGARGSAVGASFATASAVSARRWADELDKAAEQHDDPGGGEDGEGEETY